MINKDQPIYIPTNPFWQVFKTFGRDELIAGILSFVITGAFEAYFYLAGIPYDTTWLWLTPVIWLAIAGPVFEKIGFFVGHIYDAIDVYKTTPDESRKPFYFYVKQVGKGGTKSLLQDIIIHDPVYISMMLLGMHLLPATPAWLLVPFSYTIAILIVAFGEVSFNEFRYKRLLERLKKQGFGTESYLESHFIVKGACENPVCLQGQRCPTTTCYGNPDVIIQELRDTFIPDAKISHLEYSDAYFEPELPEYNARSPRIRIRKRTTTTGGISHTLQIIYTRSIEVPHSYGHSQFRFFPILKDKIYFILDPDAVYNTPSEITVIKLTSDTDPDKITFSRFEAHDVDKLLISVDTIKDSAHIVEIKAYPKNKQLLKEAMRYAMFKFPIVQTTYHKSDQKDYSAISH